MADIPRTTNDSTLYDENGNPVAIIKEGNIYKVGTQASCYFLDSPNLDTFGRLRVSNPKALFESKYLHDSDPLWWDDSEVSGGGTSSTYNSSGVNMELGVSNLTVGKRVRQTFRRFNYQSGKSHLIFISGIFGSTSTGIKKCMGYFDENNGLFFTVDEGTLKVVRRTNASGSTIDNEISQDNFNLDTLDGNGPSGLTIDLTKIQIMVIDFQWLGAGRVRMGFDIDGKITYCHHFLNANNLDEVWMNNPNLPIRISIENDGSGANDSIKHICSSILSEGGLDGISQTRSSSPTYSIGASDTNDIYVVGGLRLKSTNLNDTIDFLRVSLLAETVDDFEWMLLFNPTLNNNITFTPESNGSLEIGFGNMGNTSDSTVNTEGIRLDGGYVSAGASAGSVNLNLPNSIKLGSAIDGTRDEMYLCVRPLSTGLDIRGTIIWRETI